jgi:hypothetical protein
MFGKNKGKQKDSDAKNEKLVKRILGKDSSRPVFGFPCSRDISDRIRMLAGQLHVDIYALGQHALQLSAEVIGRIVEDPEGSELLRKHITEIHVDARTIEKIDAYDRDMCE